MSLTALAALLALLLSPGTAAADHTSVQVSAPTSATLGERVEITSTVQDTASGAPVEGAELVFYAAESFAGVTGDVELGRQVTNRLGIAVFRTEMRTLGTHVIRVEGEHDSNELSIEVTAGGQLHRSEARVSIPGVGSWAVKAVIATVWVIMLIAGVNLVRAAVASRRDAVGSARGSWANVATVATAAMFFLAVGILTILFRSPNTLHNLNPDGYRRSAVAYVEGAYVYPDFGVAEHVSGSQADVGRALFVTKGCAGCHGVNAEGTTTAGSPASASFFQFYQTVRNGIALMPAFSTDELSDAEIDAIYSFLAEAAPDQQPAPSGSG